MGVNVALYKTLTFGVSALYTGVAGALGAIAVQFVAPDSFTFSLSIALFVGLVIGGVGSMGGVLIGAIIVTISPFVTSAFTGSLPNGLFFSHWLHTNVYYINTGLYGVIVLLFLLYQPRGAVETAERFTHLRDRFHSHRSHWRH